jgi:predicted RecB family nuclease
LTSKLTGWHVDIDAEAIQAMGFEEKVAAAVAQVATIPGISPDEASVLVHCGFHTLDELAAADANDLAAMPGLQERAPAIVEAVRAEVAKRSGGGTQ